MERYNQSAGSASAPTAPAAPTNKFFTVGNPGGGTPATVPGEWWFHMLTEELRAVIIEGGLTPDHTSLTQVRDAIKNIVKGGDYKDSVRVASTTAINLAAPGANIDGVAMVIGDRFLEKDNATLANRGIYIWNGVAITATRALDADIGAEFNGGAIIPVESGTINADTNWQITNDGTVTIGTTGLTFACLETKLFTGSNQSLSTSGYQKLPGGLIIQWGTGTTSSGLLAVTFPIAFPTIGLNATPSYYAGSLLGDRAYINASAPTVSGVTFYFATNAGAAVAPALVRWFAIGY